MATYIKASTYYIEELLKSVDAIKRKSFFNSTAVVDAQELDTAIKNMIEWAAIVGSQEPETAGKILDTFQSSMSQDELFKEASLKWNKTCPQNNNPLEAVSPAKFSEEAETIEINHLQTFDIQVKIARYCMEGLIWGIHYPEAVMDYMTSTNQPKATLSQYQQIDPNIDRIPDISEIVSESKEIARKYLATVPS